MWSVSGVLDVPDRAGPGFNTFRIPHDKSLCGLRTGNRGNNAPGKALAHVDGLQCRRGLTNHEA